MKDREEDDARQRQALADRLQQLRGEELIGAPQRRQAARHRQTGEADADEADRGHKTRIHAPEHHRGQWADDQLRRGDPHQRLAHVQRPKPPHHLQVLGDQVGGGKDRQAQEGDQQQQPREGLGEDHLQIDQGMGRDRIVNEKGRDQNRARH